METKGVAVHAEDTGDPADGPNLPYEETVDTVDDWCCGARGADRPLTLPVVMSLSKPLNYSTSVHIILDKDSLPNPNFQIANHL
jgi:hypothetical protein